jgi:exonuclease III
LDAYAVPAASEWVDGDYDIICVQEARVDAFAVIRAMARVNSAAKARALELRRSEHLGFDYKFCPNPVNHSAGGVLVLWKLQLASSGVLEVLPENPGDRDASGRLLVARFKWGGHTFQLACVYAPSGDSVGRQDFFDQVVAPVWAASPGSSIFVGDWNCVEAPLLDRRWRGGEAYEF